MQQLFSGSQCYRILHICKVDYLLILTGYKVQNEILNKMFFYAYGTLCASGRFISGTFCPWDFLSLGCFIPLDILSLRHLLNGICLGNFVPCDISSLDILPLYHKNPQDTYKLSLS
jgi:hypothetical protein